MMFLTRCLSVVFAGLTVVSTAGAQQFEVASVRITKADNGISGISVNGNRLTGNNMSLLSYIRRAYGVSEFQVIGPDWIKSDGFDIDAKAPDGSSADDLMPMLQRLLEERFKLVMHRDSKVVAVYEMRVAPGGLKVNASSGQGNLAAEQSAGRLGVRGASMARFAEVLTRETDRPVMDRTRLSGIFDFALEWTPDGLREAGAADVPALFAAVQEQLGLKLQPNRAQIGVLVVDSAERVPTEN